MAELSMKAVCQLTGLNPSTLRAWERRYQAVRPDRTPTGRRLYSYRDVERLRLLASLVGAGHNISRLAALSDSELGGLQEQPGVAPAAPEEPRPAPMLEQFFEDLSQYNLRSLSLHLAQSRHLFDLRSFVVELVSPLLAEVGERVAAGQINIAQEHALSAILRAQLGQIMQGLFAFGAPDSRPRVLFATPEDELHEFGILLSALLCGYWGLEVFYLGPNLPAESLGEAADALGADYIVLGTSSLTRDLPKYLADLDRHLKGLSCEILIGGAATMKLSLPLLKHAVRPLASLGALEALFKNLTPRAVR